MIKEYEDYIMLSSNYSQEDLDKALQLSEDTGKPMYNEFGELYEFGPPLD